MRIYPLSKWSIGYYNRTADAASSVGGGLGEYYTEHDTRRPTWMAVGDTAKVGELTGLDGGAVQGGVADTATVARWLDDGSLPNGRVGRGFGAHSVHGFDLTFSAPKSVSLIRVFTSEVAEKALQEAHILAVRAAMCYLHTHAGYTRIHNPANGKKDLQRLPGLVAVAYQHETSRCGDPHLHTHVIVPNRQARADGTPVSVDSRSFHHEAKAAGTVYQAVLRHEAFTMLGLEWDVVAPHSGMAEVAEVSKDVIKAWSRSSTRLRQWAAKHLHIVDEPTAAQLAEAQRAARLAKPEQLPWQELKAQWLADRRGFALLQREYEEAKTRRLAEKRVPLDRARIVALAAEIDKATFTRADLVEIIGAQLPYDAADPSRLIEGAADQVSLRVTAPREPHEREGHERFTLDTIMAEEERVFGMVDARDDAVVLPVIDADVAGLEPDQAAAMRNIAASAQLVCPLQAPAGAGKTFSLAALHRAALRAHREMVVVAPTGKAVDEAMSERVADYGLTVAKALRQVERGEWTMPAGSIVVVDEAAMVGTPDLRKLLACAAVWRAKMVMVGDSYQLSPVLSRGGVFDDLCAELPWAQHLAAVRRMTDPEERDVSLALRSAHGGRLNKAVGWYRKHDRLHVGDEVTMAADASARYAAALRAGVDALLMCDSWELADNINTKLVDDLVAAGPSVGCARDQSVRAGAVIITRRNDPTVQVASRDRRPADEVRNGNRWRVAHVNTRTGAVAAERLTDGARAMLPPEYVAEHVTLGYAVTVASVQGVTVDRAFAVVHESASRQAVYVAMTRGRDTNELFVCERPAGEADHDHTALPDRESIVVARRGSKWAAAAALRAIVAHDERPRTMHTEADRTERELLPAPVVEVLQRQDVRRDARRARWETRACARAVQVDIPQRGHPDYAARLVQAREEYREAQERVAVLRQQVMDGRGPAMLAAAPRLAELRQRADADRPYQLAVAEVQAGWESAEADYGRVLGFVEAARDEMRAVQATAGVDPLDVASARAGLRLAMMALPEREPAARYQQPLTEAVTARAEAAGGADRIVTAADVDAARLAAEDEDRRALDLAVRRRDVWQTRCERLEFAAARSIAGAEHSRSESRQREPERVFEFELEG